MPLDEKQIRALAGSSYFSRGLSYFNQGLVSGVRPITNGIAARVKGSRWYDVEVALHPGGKPQYFCSCPLGLDGEFCKHCVAVSLAWLQQPAVAAPVTTKPKASKGGLAIAARAAFEKAVRAPEERGDVPSYEVWEWVEKVQNAAAKFANLLAGPEAAEVPKLCEWALGELDRALDYVDDEDDETLDIESQLVQTHIRACELIRPDPLELAARLLRLQMQFQYGAFAEIFPGYRGALGDAGVAEYRRLLQSAYQSAKPADREYLTGLLEHLERHCGDFDSLSKLLTKDLRSLAQYLPVIEMYRDAGRIEEAAQWADRGFKAYRDENDPSVVNAATELYHRLGRHDDAVQLIWNRFYAHPYLDTYIGLKKHAELGSVWPEWRVRALLELRMRIDQDLTDKIDVDHSALVEIFLHENDVEAAWLEATQGGCDSRLWLRLARSRAKDHPEESGMALLAQAELAMREAPYANYEEAVDLLIEAAKHLQRARKTQEFVARLHALRLEHKAKRGFIQRTDRHRRELLF